VDRRHWIALLGGAVVVLLLGLLLGLVGGATDTGTGPQRTASPVSPSTDPASGLPWVAEADLPPEAHETLALIDDDGPYPHPQDDGTFFNREGLLPDEQEGYYREYTVETPGADDRGPRRIVTGAEGEYYWTSDHYASFERIAR
jgi:ribonuclease T1